MKIQLSFIIFFFLMSLLLNACIERSEERDSDTEIVNTQDQPINEEVPHEAISPEELRPSISEEDIEKFDKLALDFVMDCSKEAAIEKLTEGGIEIGARQLVDSCLLKSRKLVLLLIKAGVDPSQSTRDGRYPIFAACMGGDKEIISDLLENGAKLEVKSKGEGSPAIHYAAKSGNKEAVDFLLEHGSNVDDRNTSAQTTLMVVCADSNLEMAKYLITLGADINVKDRNDRGPLHSSVNAGSLPIVKLLVEKGADINTLDKQARMSPIYASAMMGHEDVFFYLLEAGAVLQKETRNGINIIHAACLSQSKEIVALLLERGFDINEYWEENGGLPIHASLEGYEANREFVTFLIHNGADINAINKLGFSPLALAAVRGYTDIFYDLLAAGADPEAVNQMGVPMLHYVIMNNNAEMVQTMVDLGVDVFAKDSEGKTALDRSIEYSSNNSERVLREAMGMNAASK